MSNAGHCWPLNHNSRPFYKDIAGVLCSSCRGVRIRTPPTWCLCMNAPPPQPIPAQPPTHPPQPPPFACTRMLATNSQQARLSHPQPPTFCLYMNASGYPSPCTAAYRRERTSFRFTTLFTTRTAAGRQGQVRGQGRAWGGGEQGDTRDLTASCWPAK